MGEVKQFQSLGKHTDLSTRPLLSLVYNYVRFEVFTAGNQQARNNVSSN
jgi:hypothetical protein